MKKIKNFILVILVFVAFSSYAQNNGPNAPEASGFEAVDAPDMVNLVTGDVTYVLPLFTVLSPEGGYPITLNYHAGIQYDQESSWIGLGWNLNPGTINRSINGFPDDWNNGIIREVDAFFYRGQSITIGISDPSGLGLRGGIGYNWDSNGAQGGFVSVGYGVKGMGGGDLMIGYQFSTHKFNVNASVGIQRGGFSIGVSGGTNGLGASIGTRFSSGIGMNVGISSNGISAGINYGKSKNGYLEGNSIGMNFSSDGVSVSLAHGNGTGKTYGMSITSSKTSTTNLGLMIPLGVVNINLGYQKVDIKKHDINRFHVFGPIYFAEDGLKHSISNSELEDEYQFLHIQNFNYFMDTYELNLPPHNEIELITFKELEQKEKPSFTFPGFDSYQVTGQGISGILRPHLFENGTLLGQGKRIQTVNGQSEDLSYDEYFKVNYHYGNGNNDFSKSISGYGNARNKIYFYFENMFAEDVDVLEQILINNNNGNNNVLDAYLGNVKGNHASRVHSSNYVRAMTNGDIVSFNDVLEPIVSGNIFDRKNEYGEVFLPDGIGGYQITVADGKTYHYMLPVYAYEEIHRTVLPTDNGGRDYKETRRVTPYATHWLLTAITGPDYVKNTPNEIKYPSEKDYGYWIRFDYGKWTDGYVWRTPYTGEFAVTNDDDPSDNIKEFSFGRKQLVYLDRIVTRTHTALFVKSPRNDAIGKQVDEEGTHFWNNILHPNSNNQTDVLVFNQQEPEYHDGRIIHYPSERPLKLDEIILLRNDNAKSVSNYSGATMNTGELVTCAWTESPGTITYHKSHLDKVLDNTDINPSVYDHALKVIRLDNNHYTLAQGTKSSVNSGGRLTLYGVKVLGKNATQYLPDYKFTYYGENIRYTECLSGDCQNRSPWGYYKNNETAWSLKEIQTPSGGKINIKYEKDDYYTEAFTRRYWNNDLDFKISRDGNGSYLIKVRKQCNVHNNLNFEDYFEVGRRAYLDLWIGFRYVFAKNVTQHNTTASFDLTPQYGAPTVVDVHPNLLTLKINRNIGYGDLISHKGGSNYSGDGRFLNKWFSFDYMCSDNSDGCDSHVRGDYPAYHSAGWGNPYNHHIMYYGIVANRVPIADTGGGLRVARIEVSDENNNTYTTVYDYDDPTLPANRRRTSGITSYAPVRGTKYVPYQSELPGPRVMYEYVTVKSEGSNGETLGYSTYHFNTLKPVVKIFDPNLKMPNIFEAKVIERGRIDNHQKINATEIKLHDNTAGLGTLLSSAVYNKEGHKLSEQKNNLLDYSLLGTANYPKGTFQESFHSMKTIRRLRGAVWNNRGTPVDDIIRYLIQHNRPINVVSGSTFRQLNASSKITYPLVIESSESISGNERNFYWNQNWDLVMGKTTETKTQMADGSYIINKIIPAYTKYPEMGSKVDNVNNKNMLTQEAMNITSWSQNGVSNWKTLNAGITTWKNRWRYRDQFGNQASPRYANEMIWRKNKIYVWKEAITNDGFYSTNITEANDYFDWGSSHPTSNKWQKTSEITRYTHWSLPIEGKDINNNYLSSKMVDNFTKTSVSGNARYTEMYYTGCEYIAPNSYTTFDNEIGGVQNQSDYVAHTGTYSVRVGPHSKVFQIGGYVARDGDAEFRPGKYKVSVWAYKVNNREPWKNIILQINNNQSINCTDWVEAGNWVQLNYFFELNSGALDLYLTSNIDIDGPDDYLDDFRLHPIASKISSFVYDHNTDELTDILGPNNMATHYVYDKAGRLCKIFNEVADAPNLRGGFKLTAHHKYHYKGITNFNCNSAYDIINGAYRKEASDVKETEKIK